MSIRFPEHVNLAHLPTPLERPRVMCDALGLDLWIKRDDLTGSAMGGNKVRKLEFLAAEALKEGADTLLTCGAVNSNHARATAVVAARLGLKTHLLLRGDAPALPYGNLLLDRMLGAKTTFIPLEAWRERDAHMARIAEDVRAKGGKAYTIPEGGSNGLGAMGYARAVQELLRQEVEKGIRIRRIFHATGSGGTTAGLALGVAAAGRTDIEVYGVAVSDGEAYFTNKIRAILDDALAQGLVSKLIRDQARWHIVEGYKGRGYGKTTPAEMKTYATWAREEGLFLDPVYTGKAMRGLEGEIRSGRLFGDDATVFIHTGGIFGLFSYAEEIQALEDGA